MPFFFPNSSSCSICESTIAKHKEAIVLGYIDHKIYPDFLKFVRSFVHRTCFETWDQKQQFVDASFELVKLNKNNYFDVVGPCLTINYGNNKIILFDYYSIFEFEIPKERFKEIMQDFNSLIACSQDEMQFGEWNVSRKIDAYKLVEKKEGQVFDELWIAQIRFEEIINFLNELDNFEK